MADRYISCPVSQTHSAVVALSGPRQLHCQLVALAIQDHWLKSQLISKMELLENLSKALRVCLRRNPQILASGLGRHIVCNGSLLAPQPLKPQDPRRSVV